MARRTKELTIMAEGRDKDKLFLLTEMPAVQAEKWAGRALLALLKSGVELPDDAAQAGIAGIAAVGLKAFGSINWADAEPLLDEMMTCVQVIPNKRDKRVVRGLFEEDIEEVTTLFMLRKELLELHLGFSLAAKFSTSPTSAAAIPESSNDTSMSPQ
jgi:hypothetical protein